MRLLRERLLTSEGLPDALDEIAPGFSSLFQAEIADEMGGNAIMTCFVEAGIDHRPRCHLSGKTKAYIRAN